jgi:hypothetical protein
MTWTDHAACKGMPLAMWVIGTPNRHTKRPTPAEQVALAVCAGCPVSTECLDDELDTMEATGGLTYGVRGGTIPPQRHQIRDRRHRTQGAA